MKNPWPKNMIAKVMKQLPGIEEPKIMILHELNYGMTAEEAATVLAAINQKPVALVDKKYKLLAYRVPR